MRIFVPKEVDPIETRVPLLPDIAGKLAGLGAKLEVELGLGSGLRFTDADYQRAGATISRDRIRSLKEADMVIKPLRVFIIGVGVAGLQAIATARRLGASVEAFDTRPVVEEQVKSLGARFVKVELGETSEVAGGYAKELTPEQLRKQREEMARHVAQADVVITAAQVFGKKAPVIVTAEMIRQMKPGSLIVDTAIDTGGNVECSKYNEETNINGVKVVAFANLPGRVAAHASEMFSNNLGAFVDHFWDRNTKCFQLDLTNPILKGCGDHPRGSGLQ